MQALLAADAPAGFIGHDPRALLHAFHNRSAVTRRSRPQKSFGRGKSVFGFPRLPAWNSIRRTTVHNRSTVFQPNQRNPIPVFPCFEADFADMACFTKPLLCH